MRSSRNSHNKKINQLAEKVSEKIDEIDTAERESHPGTLRTSTKQLSALYEDIGDTYLDYSKNADNKKEKVSSLQLAKDHYQFAIDELNKLSRPTSRLSLYLDHLHVLDQLLKIDNLHADMYAKQMLASINEIQQKQLLDLPCQKHIFLDDGETQYDFAMYWLPIYLEHIQDACPTAKNLKREHSAIHADIVAPPSERAFKRIKINMQRVSPATPLSSISDSEKSVDMMVLEEETHLKQFSFFNPQVFNEEEMKQLFRSFTL